MSLTSQKRARSRLNTSPFSEAEPSRFSIEQSSPDQNISKRRQKLGKNSWSLNQFVPLLYLLVGSSLTTYILYFVQPDNIRNIPVPDSYGPLLFSSSLAIYGLLKFVLRSKILSLILTFILIIILSLKLQNFHDIL